MECEFEELNDELKAIAIDTAHFGNKIVNLQQSSFVLGVRKELLLVIKGGVVRLSSPNNFVTLTPNCWMKLIDYWVEINKEKKAFIHMSRSASYRAHIGDEYYVTINSSARVVDISRYMILSYAPSCVRVYSTGEGVSLRFDEWTHLSALIPSIHEHHPELSIGLGQA